MTEIVAKGIRRGVPMIVRVKGDVIRINGLQNDLYDWAIYAQYPIGGTYFAEAQTPENVLNTLSYHFFDEKPEIDVIGELEEIPYEENVIY